MEPIKGGAGGTYSRAEKGNPNPGPMETAPRAVRLLISHYDSRRGPGWCTPMNVTLMLTSGAAYSVRMDLYQRAWPGEVEKLKRGYDRFELKHSTSSSV